MRGLICLAVCFVIALPVLAQEGHPLTGTWHGDWGTTAKDRTDVTLVLEWDGKNISGIINPGPESLKLLKATLDPANWSVHFEAGGIVIDGKIQNLTSIRRSIVGTWSNGKVKADFKVTRDQ
jgi:hypothetical protein